MRQIDEPRLVGRASHVEPLERGEELDVSLDRIGEPEQEEPPLGAGQTRPGAAVHLRTGGRNRCCDVVLGRGGDGGEVLLARRRNDIEGAAVGGVLPATTDEELGVDLRNGDAADVGHGRDGAHINLLLD